MSTDPIFSPLQLEKLAKLRARATSLTPEEKRDPAIQAYLGMFASLLQEEKHDG